MKFDFVAPCYFGTESAAAFDFKRIGAENVAVTDGRVSFSGDEAILAAANLYSRCAERILIRLACYPAKTFDELFDGILTLKDREDCYRFFEDICTVNEIHAIAQRLQVAKLLSQKKTYTEIEEETKASTATISRINKCLVYGADGYRRVLDRLSEEEK